MDRSHGYERVAAEFLAGRGNGAPGVGTAAVRAWARQLAPGATVLELGCGPGVPITAVLVEAGLAVHAVDASPTFVAAFKRRFPDTPIACEPVEESSFFDRRFDAVLSWGLMFLLSPPSQRALIRRMGEALTSGGRLLFTSPAEAATWSDAMTGCESRSLGAEEYRRLLSDAGLRVLQEYDDEGENHYYDAIKGPIDSPTERG